MTTRVDDDVKWCSGWPWWPVLQRKYTATAAQDAFHTWRLPQNNCFPENFIATSRHFIHTVWLLQTNRHITPEKNHVLSILSMGSSAVSAYRLCCIQLVLPATGRLYFYRRLIVCLFAGLPKNYSISLHKIHHIQWRSSTRATEETTRWWWQCSLLIWFSNLE